MRVDDELAMTAAAFGDKDGAVASRASSRERSITNEKARCERMRGLGHRRNEDMRGPVSICDTCSTWAGGRNKSLIALEWRRGLSSSHRKRDVRNSVDSAIG